MEIRREQSLRQCLAKLHTEFSTLLCINHSQAERLKQVANCEYPEIAIVIFGDGTALIGAKHTGDQHPNEVDLWLLLNKLDIQ